MSAPDESSTAALVDFLLREPEVVAWLEPVRETHDDEEDEPPRAA